MRLWTLDSEVYLPLGTPCRLAPSHTLNQNGTGAAIFVRTDQRFVSGTPLVGTRVRWRWDELSYPCRWAQRQVDELL